MKYLDKKLEEIIGSESNAAISSIYMIGKKSSIKYWLLGLLLFIILFMLMPWTQNIRGRGTVTTLFQDQRPQELNSVIPGRIVSWRVKEGDHVKKGDTILTLSEVKEDYLDPNILQRTEEQIVAKQSKASNYGSKAGAAGNQILALEQSVQFKLSQTRNKIKQQELKVQSEQASMEAAQTNANIAAQQYTRNQELYKQGLISLTDLETKQNKMQEAKAKQTSASIAYENAQQELSLLQININSIQQEYNEKIAKIQSDRFQSLSEIANTEGEIAKLKNQYSTYDARQKLYIVTAPQEGQITDARVAGIGEIIKEGEHIVTIVPEKIQYTVELFIKPLDVPLVQRDQHVTFLFDGFPAIIFSGWPGASYGTFTGKVLTIENNTNSKGYYRVLVIEDPASNKPWPKQLRIGAGAKGIALLKTVPIWYELWRNINGFPPDYYKPQNDIKDEKK